MPLNLRFMAAAILLLPALASSAHAVIRTVQLDGSGDFTVIQDALEASVDGDSVLVGPGVYTWTNQGSGDDHGMVRYWLNEQDGIRLISTDGPNATILDAEGMGRVFFANGSNFDRNDVYVEGFTLRNGYAPKVPNREEQEGGAMAFHLTYGTIVNCIFEDNQAEHGGAVWCGGEGAYTFRDCRFVNNRAVKIKDTINPVAGAIVFIGPAINPERSTLVGCTFISNHSDYLAGGVFASQANLEIRDCLFSANSSPSAADRRGTGIYGSNCAFMRLEGVTVRDHASSPGEAVRIAATQTFEMERSNLSHNVSGLNVQLSDVANASVFCTNIHGGFPGNWVGELAGFRTINDNLQVDPMFCGETGDLRRVDSASPMVATNNACGVDIGRVVGDCFSVPVLATNLRATRTGGGATIEWEGVEPARAGVKLLRRSAGQLQELDTGAAMGRAGSWSLEDPSAPLGPVTYVLLDREGNEVARTGLNALGLARLLDPSPNPFNPRTRVGFELGRPARISLEVYDARGRRVATLARGPRDAGLYEEVFDGRDSDGHDVGSGVYYLRLRADEEVLVDSVVLIR